MTSPHMHDAYLDYRRHTYPGKDIPSKLSPEYALWMAAWRGGMNAAAQLVRHFVNGRGPLREQFADAIEEQAGMTTQRKTTIDPASCPKCQRSFKGKPIPKRDQEAFGGETHFSVLIGVYDMDKDRTVAWRCPFCAHQWER